MPWWSPPTSLHSLLNLTFSMRSEQRNNLVWGTWRTDHQNKAFTQWQNVTLVSRRSLRVTSLIVACFWISYTVIVTPVESRCDSLAPEWLASHPGKLPATCFSFTAISPGLPVQRDMPQHIWTSNSILSLKHLAFPFFSRTYWYYILLCHCDIHMTVYGPWLPIF